MTGTALRQRTACGCGRKRQQIGGNRYGRCSPARIQRNCRSKKAIMLHDPSHHSPPPPAAEVKLSPSDKDILRRLASAVAQIAALPVHREKARLWRDLNDL